MSPTDADGSVYAESLVANALNALDSPYYRLAETEPLWELVTAYLRSHPDECLPAGGSGADAK